MSTNFRREIVDLDYDWCCGWPVPATPEYEVTVGADGDRNIVLSRKVLVRTLNAIDFNVLVA